MDEKTLRKSNRIKKLEKQKLARRAGATLGGQFQRAKTARGYQRPKSGKVRVKFA